jgi:hypothetical protein
MSQDFGSSSLHQMALYRGPGHAYQAYNEQAFRHFLVVERKRAERAARSLLLLLVEVEAEGNESTTIGPFLAERMFAALHGCIREVDFIGWYRLHRIVGAVLTPGAGAGADSCRQIGERAAAALAGHLPAHVSPGIRVRVLQLQSTSQG